MCWIELWGKIEDTQWNERAYGSRCKYKGWGNMRCFGNLIVISSSFIGISLYDIVEWFSFIRECKHS